MVFVYAISYPKQWELGQSRYPRYDSGLSVEA